MLIIKSLLIIKLFSRLIFCLLLFNYTCALDFVWDFGGWLPIEGPCKTCFPLQNSGASSGKETRSRRQFIPEEGSEDQNILPARVQLVYLPEGSLQDLQSAQLAKLVDFSRSQLRSARATNINGFNLPTFQEVSANRPTALVAERGKEREAFEQIQLLEAALQSQQNNEEQGELPRVFIAPTHVPPPPGYVKIPLLPSKSQTQPNEPLPGTFLTSGTQEELPPGFVQVPLPQNVAELSHQIPFVHPNSNPQLKAHFSPAGTLSLEPIDKPSISPIRQETPAQGFSHVELQAPFQPPNLIAIPPIPIRSIQKASEKSPQSPVLLAPPPQQQQNFLQQQQLQQEQRQRQQLQQQQRQQQQRQQQQLQQQQLLQQQRVQQPIIRERPSQSEVQIGTSVIQPTHRFSLPRQEDKHRQPQQQETNINTNVRGRRPVIEEASQVQRLVPQLVVAGGIRESGIQINDAEPDQRGGKQVDVSSIRIQNPRNKQPALAPVPVSQTPVQTLDKPTIKLPQQPRPKIRIRPNNIATSNNEIQDNTIVTQDVTTRRRPQPTEPPQTTRTTERTTAQTTESPQKSEVSTLFPPFEVARQKSRQRNGQRPRTGTGSRGQAFGSRLRTRVRNPNASSRVSEVNSQSDQINGEQSANAVPQRTANNNEAIRRSRQRVRAGSGAGGRRPVPEWVKRRRRVLSRVRKVPKPTEAQQQQETDNEELRGSASAKVFISQKPNAPVRNTISFPSNLKHRPDISFGTKKRLSANKMESLKEEKQVEVTTEKQVEVMTEQTPVEEMDELFPSTTERELTTLSPFDFLLKESLSEQKSKKENFEEFYDASAVTSSPTINSKDAYETSGAHIVYAVALAEPFEKKEEPVTEVINEATTVQPEEEIVMEDTSFNDLYTTTSPVEGEEDDVADSTLPPSFNFLEKFFSNVPISSPNEIPTAKKNSRGKVISQSVVTEVRSSAPTICFGNGKCIVTDSRKTNS